ncbi:hypothetical protein [Paenibacillus sp. RC73]|uniref:hypothetical protein n=1 Tax=Paenibacillus sp. RC73 TaxID=3156250 RepID=UPI0038512584
MLKRMNFSFTKATYTLANAEEARAYFRKHTFAQLKKQVPSCLERSTTKPDRCITVKKKRLMWRPLFASCKIFCRRTLSGRWL